jgi:hypothetical protein
MDSNDLSASSLPTVPKSEPTIKDSGARQQFDSGMVRDVTTDKINYALALDGPLFERYARHLTLGARKYAERNWMKASGAAELKRFRESALRHFWQWWNGETDEDHFAACVFNLNGAEYVKGCIESASLDEQAEMVERAIDSQKEIHALEPINSDFGLVPISTFAGMDMFKCKCGRLHELQRWARACDCGETIPSMEGI